MMLELVDKHSYEDCLHYKNGYTDQLFKNFYNLQKSIFNESINQTNKWGVQTHSLFEWQNYITEELGELASAIAEFEYRNGNWEDIYKEAIQVATLSLKVAEMIKHGKS